MSSLTASDFKNAGNKLCAVFRYDEAITYYDKAISKNPEVPIYFSNRALCYLKLKQWPEAIHDCHRALELDPNIIKAHFYLGQALAELYSYDDSLKHLQRAHELAKERKMNFGDDIAYQIRLIKRNRWTKIESETMQLEDELRKYLIGLIKKDTEEKLNQKQQQEERHSQVIRDNEETRELQQPVTSSSSAAAAAANNVCLPSTSSSNRREVSQEPAEEEDIQSKCDNYISKLESMFDNLKLERKKRDVPDYLCGKISFEIMHDPVITPSGITYDRQDIEEHLKRVGHFDPITRQPLVARQLIPNLAMKEVVDAYLHENEWAQYY